MGRFIIALFAFIGIHHWTQVWIYSVDVPFWDEWEYLAPEQLPAGFSMAWLHQLHNEHRIALTRIQTFLLYKLNGWDASQQQVMNFGIYFFAVCAFLYALSKWNKSKMMWVLAAFGVFLLSPRLVENHLWGFQSQFHFAWAFAFAAAFCWFREVPTWRTSVAGTLCAVLSIYSFSGGVLSTAAITGVYLVFGLFRMFRYPLVRRETAVHLFAVVTPVFVTTSFWAIGFKKPPAHAEMAMPWTRPFWDFFANLVSSGWGIDQVDTSIGLGFFAVMTVPMIGLLCTEEKRFDARVWGLVAIFAAVLAFLASIAAGRAGFGDLGLSKSSRYTEIGGLLIPPTVLAWCLLLDGKVRLNRSILTILWAICYLSFRNDWSYERNYTPVKERRIRGLACLNAYYFQGGVPNCPDLYPWAAADKFDAARNLNLSFYADLERARH